MALDRTNSMEWNDIDALKVNKLDTPQILDPCREEDRSDINSLVRTESKEETRSNEAACTVSVGSRSTSSNTKKKLSLTSFLKKSSEKKSSNNSRSGATNPLPGSTSRKSLGQRSVKTASDLRSNRSNKSKDMSNQGEICCNEQTPKKNNCDTHSVISKQSSQSKKSSIKNHSEVHSVSSKQSSKSRKSLTNDNREAQSVTSKQSSKSRKSSINEKYEAQSVASKQSLVSRKSSINVCEVQSVVSKQSISSRKSSRNNNCDVESCVSKQSSKSRKSTRSNKSDINWEMISSKALSIVDASKSIKDNKEVACKAIMNAIATKSNESSSVEINSFPQELSEVAAIASNIALEEIMKMGGQDAMKDSKKLASYTAKAIMRAGTASLKADCGDKNDISTSTDLSSHLAKINVEAENESKEKEAAKSIVSNRSKKSTRSIHSSNTHKSSKSVKSNGSRKSSKSQMSSVKVNEQCIDGKSECLGITSSTMSDALNSNKDSVPIRGNEIISSEISNRITADASPTGEDNSDNQSPNENILVTSISQFLNMNNISNEVLSSGNTVQSLFEKFHRWQNASYVHPDDTNTL